MPDGVTVKYTGLLAGSEQRDALISGNTDIVVMSVAFLASGLQNGLPMAYLAYTGANLYQIYTRNPDIKSIADINASHKISASAIGGSPHMALLAAAANDLGDASKFKRSIVAMHNADAVNALISGAAGIDAAICTFPTIVAAWKSDKVHLVRDLAPEIINYGIGSVFITRQDYMKDNPDIIEAFIKAYNEAVSLLHNNKPECIRIMQKAYKDIDEATASRMLDYYTASIDAGIANYDKLMDFLYQNGILEKPAAKFQDVPEWSSK